MKKLFKDTKKISYFTLLILTFSSFAAFAGTRSPKARVESVVGSVFVKNNGQTIRVTAGDHLYDFSEIFTEEGGQITFTNFYDQEYILSGSGHVKLMNRIVDIKSGYVWFKAHTASEVVHFLQTANSKVDFKDGAGIISYDRYSGKTQFLSIKGQFYLRNIFQEDLVTEVSTGEFSFVDKSYNSGAPRLPTPIGALAFTKITGLFKKTEGAPVAKVVKTQDLGRENPSDYFVRSEKKTSRDGRDLASVPEKPGGKIIFLKKKSSVGSVPNNSALDYFKYKTKKKKVPYKFTPTYKKSSGVKVHVYAGGPSGERGPASVSSRKKRRGPASMTALNPQVEIKKSAFENSLMEEYKKQRRHSGELNSLIKELKSFDQDYKVSY